MPRFRRVEGDQAGPAALGILVPPGRRTLLIVRPRALEWDLIPLGDAEAASPFRELEQSEAAALANQLVDDLCCHDQTVRIEPIATSDAYHVRASLGSIVLVVCGRIPGQPYRPQPFDGVTEALTAAQHLGAYFNPTSGEQEVYLNTRNFRR